MGQAQLLLIVLGVVLVGIAIIAGISAFEQNSRKGAQDAMMHDALRLASDIQAWVQKPSQFGGPSEYLAFDEVTFPAIGYTKNHDGGDTDDDTYTSTNGTFELSAGDDGVDIVGTSTLFPDEKVAVSVCGINAADVQGEVSDTAPGCGGGTTTTGE